MFVIASSPRSGTHFLRTALNTHCDLFCHGELFHRNYRSQAFFSPLDIEIIKQRQTVLDHIGPNDGFCLHYAHLQAKDCRDIISKRKDIDRVIILYRVNQLDNYLSLLIAKKTQRWLNHTSTIRVEFDIRDFRTHLQEHEDRMLHDIRFWPQRANTIMVPYERLQDRLIDIQRFLGVSPMPVAPTTKKQENRSYSEIITNWSEVETYCNNYLNGI